MERLNKLKREGQQILNSAQGLLNQSPYGPTPDRLSEVLDSRAVINHPVLQPLFSNRPEEFKVPQNRNPPPTFSELSLSRKSSINESVMSNGNKMMM